ncbi:MAG: 1-deoxy-D-xylulose-5-phosphate synthase N-terminal domain-containing protein, partial [Bacteroidia bacterium]
MEIVKGSGFIPGELLAKINSPKDLKKLREDQLEQLSSELRQYIIDLVSVKGGHFGAS